jgi:hypothetical protein
VVFFNIVVREMAALVVMPSRLPARFSTLLDMSYTRPGRPRRQRLSFKI